MTCAFTLYLDAKKCWGNACVSFALATCLADDECWEDTLEDVVLAVCLFVPECQLMRRSSFPGGWAGGPAGQLRRCGPMPLRHCRVGPKVADREMPAGAATVKNTAGPFIIESGVVATVVWENFVSMLGFVTELADLGCWVSGSRDLSRRLKACSASWRLSRFCCASAATHP